MAIGQKTINELDRMAQEYGCEFCMPPFKKSINPFFCIEEIKDDIVKIREFLIAIKKIGVRHTFVKIKNKNYIEIKE